MIAQNYFKLKQMTYLIQNLHDQVKILEKYFDIKIFFLSSPIQKSSAKNHYQRQVFLQ